MALVKCVQFKEVEYKIDEAQALKALAEDLGVYKFLRRTHKTFYDVDDNKLYYYVNVGCHELPSYQKTECIVDELTIKNFELIRKLSQLNDISLS